MMIHPIFQDYLKAPFDEEDLKRIYNGNSNPTYSLLEMAVIWGALRGAEILEEIGYEDAASIMEAYVKDPEDFEEEEEEEQQKSKRREL